MNPYKVSIITVCLNSEASIRRTIESVLHQTYNNIEYLIIDGGSTDRTIEIIEEYQTIFEGHLQYISERDQGIYDAMNKGILHAAGDVIGIINSDDRYEPDAVERAVKCFEETDAEAVYGEIWLIGQHGEREYHTWHSAFPPHPSTFIKREVYQKCGMFDLKYHIASDRELLLRLIAGGIRFEHIDAILADFSKTGISNTKSLECAQETYEIDLKYFGRCADTFNRDAIEEKYERARFLYISQTRSQIIRETLGKYRHALDSIAIFGAGNCGKELMTVLETCGISVRLFADNDESKWGLEFHGIKIYSPEILRDFDGHVVVTVTKYQQDLCRQLRNYGNPALSWSTLGEMRQKAIRCYERG
nr:glycosyltransferase [uncultured Acetatifactor sp.]